MLAEKHMPWYTGPIYIITNRLGPVWLDMVRCVTRAWHSLLIL